MSKSCRTRLMLATALTGSFVLMPALTMQVWADETVNSDETVIGSGGGTKGSTWDIADDLSVGLEGTGTLTISDGGEVSSGQAFVGRDDDGNGTVTITGANSTWEIKTGNNLYLGSLGTGATGTLVISNGGKLLLVRGLFASLGAGSGGTGTVTVTGAGSSMDINALLSVGNYGAGTLTVSDGASVVVKGGAGTLHIALYGGSSGVLNIGDAAGEVAAAPGTIDAATISFGTGTGKLVLNHTDVNYVLDSNIIGAGVLEQHSGTTVLTGNNTYSGGTTISGGTLQIGNGGTSGSLSGNVTNNSALIFNRSDALSYTGDISGTGSLTKAGAGTLTLTGANSHTGGTTISAGTLQIGDGGTSGSLTGNIVNNSALIFNRSDALSYTGDISGTGSLTKSGAGTLTLSGANSHTGGTTISGGTLQIGNGGTVGSLSGNITNNSALVFNRSDALSYTGDISGTGSLTKSGAGTLTLTGANSHTGGTTISGGTLQIGNGGAVGSLSGNVTNNSALIFNRSDALSYTGDISGAGSLTKAGAGTLTLTGANSHTGGTTISAGTLQIGDGGTSGSLTGNIVNNSALIFNRSDALSYTGDISGTGSLTKSGAGTLTLSGANIHTGGTTISGGKLVVNGSTGAITLNGGTLGGSGTIGNVIANSGSTIAPGNSIGTLNVAGNASFAAGSTYAVEVDKNGNADKLSATGTVTIDNGATVSVTAENGTDNGLSYAVATTYKIVSAGTAVTGTFGSVSENFAFLDASLSYDANSVYLKLLRNNFSFASSATTANQRATAGALDTLASGNTLYDAVSVLSTENARSAFDSLSGEIYASANGMFIHDSRFARNAVSNRIRSAFEWLDATATPVTTFGATPGTGGAAFWSHAYGSWDKTRGNGNAAAMDHNAGGFFLGADTDIAGGWRGGLMAGYGNTGFDVAARTSSGNADSYTFGAYAGGQIGPLGVQFGASYGLHDVSVSRTVTAGTLRNALSADYRASTAQFFGEAGYSFDTRGTRFEPYAGFALIHQHNAAFTETGGAAALSVASASQTLGVTTLGLRGARQVAVGDNYTASLTGSLGWSHVVGDLDAASTMRFASGDAFGITGAPLDRDTALIEAGLKLDFGSGATFNLDYHGDLGARTQSHGLVARFSMLF
ncbi:autotransporter domain-containing protein [Hoeflea sp.]|uniref:autotransporter domain-containing protein n=1 Tax=Hoeflea sp. TaxID=1940281 RepID=UPI003A8DEAFC